MTLHIINQHPQHSEALSQCLSVCQPGDCVLLIEAALDILTDEPLLERLLAPHGHIKCFALLPNRPTQDFIHSVNKIIHLIDFEGFVNLSIDHYPVVSW